MKTIAASASVTASLLLAALGIAALAHSSVQTPAPRLIEGREKPILLGRMVVMATALPDTAR